MTVPPISFPPFEPGSVWLVGAGPGDPGLLSLLAYHALQTADVLIYDALVDERIVALVPDGVERIYAGKRGGKPSASQPDISKRLVALAREGKRVLRLKGGDPFVFGRGGEEALALVAAGLTFRVVPGVTAGIGGLAYAGIPLTHRDTNAAVTFVTGHVAGGSAPETLDWDGLARGAPVIVFYMPLKHLEEIAARLTEAGRRRDEPAAIVCAATTGAQLVLETTLGRAAEDAARAGAEPPALFVLGEVVRMRAGLDWLGALSGRVLLSDPLGTAR